MTTENPIVQVSVSDIEFDTSLQMRADDVDAEFAATLADHIREGVVVKPVTERFHQAVGRVILKVVGAGYLEKT